MAFLKKSPAYFSQTDFNYFLRCKKAFHLARHPSYDPPKEKDRVYSNAEVHRLVGSLFPGSEKVQGKNIREKLKETRKLVKEKNTILEGWFDFNDIILYIDILKYDDGWKAYGIQKNYLKKYYQAEDYALQYLVLKGNKISLTDFEVIYINKKYTLLDKILPEKLFRFRSILQAIEDNLETVEEKVKTLHEPLRDDAVNEIDIGEYCFKPHPCDFMQECWKKIPQYSVFDIASLARDRKFELYNQGILLQRDIDLNIDYEFTAAQVMQIEVEKSHKEVIQKKDLKEFLSQVKYPAFYMDFELIMPALPLFKNTRPFEHIPVQYSVIKKENPEAKEIYYDFLAEPPDFPIREFIDRLLNDLGNKGSIFVYDKRLEAGQLREISRHFPQLAEKINHVISRIVDLIIPFQKRLYYNRNMKGLSSLKSTLPALYPEYSYNDLSIQNGYMAINALESLYYEKDPEVNLKTRNALKEYCKLDTLAMIKIHQFLDKAVKD